MKAHHRFKNEIKKLTNFYKSSLYSYENTEDVIWKWNKNKEEFMTFGLELSSPKLYKTDNKSKALNRKYLIELVFVRGISALEVLLVDLVRDIFLETKEPFKIQDSSLQLSHSEILSIKTPASLYNKIINKECRRLSSGGFLEIIKYYKKHFNIEISNFSPGKSKMEEYQDRRHLLVHRLGKTDQQYRIKYNTIAQAIIVDEDYLFNCFNDFIGFAELLENQVKYKLKNELKNTNTKKKKVESKARIKIQLIKTQLKFLESNFEFWAGEEFSMFESILDKKEQIDSDNIVIDISGTYIQILSYSEIIRQAIAHKLINAEFIKVKNKPSVPPTPPRFLDDSLIKKIQHLLPEQPWETGIHKKIASELNLSNKLVSIAIQQLIGKGVFKNQFKGSITKD